MGRERKQLTHNPNRWRVVPVVTTLDLETTIGLDKVIRTPAGTVLGHEVVRGPLDHPERSKDGMFIASRARMTVEDTATLAAEHATWLNR